MTSRWIPLLLLASVACLGAEPKPDLAKLKARPAPEWLTRGVMYQVWLRGFTPEGTLRAAAKRLPAVAELGATVVYLSPICLSDPDMRLEFWSPRQKASGSNNPRNPYRIKDYDKVDPEYGTEADLHEFIDTAHGLGLRVILDLVYFHAGPTSTLLDKPGFIVRDADGKVNTGSWNFPRLNFECQGLREYLWGNMAHWVKTFNVDGFRCDVADAVPLDFWEEARDRLTPLRPDVVIFAEGQRAGNQVKAFDVCYGFSWYRATAAVVSKSEPASAIRDIHQKQSSERPQGARFTRYIENHDLVNDLLRAEVIMSERGAAAVTVIDFTIDGVPFLYNGQEIGDTSMQSIYSAWPVRWEAGCRPKAAAKLEFFKKLCQLRRGEPALYEGATVWLDNDRPDAVVSFARRAGNEEIVTVANLSNRPVEVKLDLSAATYLPLVADGAKPAAEAGKLTMKLPGFGYFVGKKK